MKTRTLLLKLAKWFPKSTAKRYHDHVGLMCGKLKEEVHKILLCLDFDEEVLPIALKEKPDLIINIGFAGSTLSKIGTWVCINKSYNFDWKIEGEEKYSMKDLGNQDLIMVNSIPNLPCYSAESFVTNSDIEENVIFDMELHSVNIIADMYKIPLMSLKKVTDNLSLEDYYENIENIIELESCVKYIKEAIASN